MYRSSMYRPSLIGLCLGAVTLAAFAPVAVMAHNSSDTPSYVNTQFVEGREGEESGRLVIRNTATLPRRVYARFQMPGDPENRNYGFVQTIPPLSTLAYDLPIGVRVFACDGRYWDDYRPDEALAVTISNPGAYEFTHAQFKPTALRRAKAQAGAGE